MVKPISFREELNKEPSPAAAARRIAGIYAVVGALWIISSDRLLTRLIEIPASQTLVDAGILKGLVFIFVTAWILFRLLHRELKRRWEISEETLLFQHLTESSADIIIVLDPADDFRMVYANKAAARHFGCAREQLLKLRLYDWSPRTTREKAQRTWERIGRENSVFFESVHRLADGREVPVEVSTNKVTFRGRSYLAGCCRDISERKQAEDLLRQERDFSKWTMDVLPGVFYVLEEDGRVRSWNPQLERITGRKPEAIRGVNCLEMLHPDDHPRTIQSIKNVFLQGEDQVDARLIGVDGTVHPHHFRGRRIEMDGRPCILGIGIDISGRQQIEAELAGQLHFQKTMMDTIPVPIFIKDQNGFFLDCNRACEEFLAIGRKDLRGKTVRDIAPPALAKAYLQKDEELFARGGGTQTYESKVRNAAGEIRDAIFHKATFSAPDGTLAGVVGAILDVTELKRAQENLLLQEQALRAAANGIIITDRDGTILWANPAFTVLTGYEMAELIGSTPKILKSGKQKEGFYEGLWKTVTAGNVWQGELVNKRKDGTLYDEEMTITPVRDADGKVSHFIAIIQNITQRKHLEAQCLRAQRMEGIGMLAGGIAHDLNNVLAPILMSIQLLADMHADADTQDILRSLQDSAQRGADIVRQVLTFARGIKGERLLLSPKHLIKDMGRVAHEAFPRNIRVCTDVAPDLWNITGDPTQLHQVLLNLSINARDAMPDGGALRLSARNQTIKDLSNGAGFDVADGDYVILSVKDTGMGISPELHERIFEPFFTTKDQGKGTGLGLSTVVGIVKSHNGWLRVISERGNGAEFLVYLPAVKGTVFNHPSHNEPAPEKGHGETVLVVDDEPPILEVAKDILTRRNYRVFTAADGTEALALIAQCQSPVNLVITDIMMPFMDGVALVRSLKKMSPETKVIVCSGLASGASMISKVEELRRLGVPTIMHKPFMANKLLRNVSLALKGEPLELEDPPAAHGEQVVREAGPR